MTFGQKLKQLRKEKHFSQSDIANFLKVDQTTISVWELDKCEPNFKTLKTSGKRETEIQREFTEHTKDVREKDKMKTKVQDAQERREPKQNVLKAWLKKARGERENKKELVKAKQVT